MTNEKILEKVKELRRHIEDGSEDLRTRIEKSKRMTYRDQWDPAVRAWNKAKERFTLSIPIIKPTIKTVVGMQIQNPKDILVEANRGGSQTGSRILTKLAKHATDSQQAIFHKTQWFEAGLAAAVGYMYVHIDKNEDPKNGNLVIEKIDEGECSLDPDCNVYDPNSFSHGAKCFNWTPWVDKELVESQYPKKVTDLKESSEVISGDTTGIWSWLAATASSMLNRVSGDRNVNSESLHENKYHLSHMWWRRPKRCLMLYDSRQNELDAVTLTKDKDIKVAKGLCKAHPDIFESYEVICNIICHTVTTFDGDVLLDNIEDELNGINMYPIVPWSPYFDCGWRGGMSEDMEGTQQEINYTHSTRMNLMKKMAQTRWHVKDDPLGEFADWLALYGNDDNLVVDESKCGGEVEVVQDKISLVGFDVAEERLINNAHRISGVRSEDASYDKANLSGRALIAKMQQSMTGNSPILMNFDYSQTILNNLIVEIIRRNKIYSLDEILEIVDTDEMIDGKLMDQARQEVTQMLTEKGIEMPDDPPQPNPRMAETDPSYLKSYMTELKMIQHVQQLIDRIAAPVAVDKLYEEISNLRRGRYNSTVTMSPFSPTMMMAEREELSETSETLLKTGQPPIPSKWLLKASNIAHKDEIIQDMEAQAKAAAMAPVMAG